MQHEILVNIINLKITVYIRFLTRKGRNSQNKTELKLPTASSGESPTVGNFIIFDSLAFPGKGWLKTQMAIDIEPAIEMDHNVYGEKYDISGNPFQLWDLFRGFSLGKGFGQELRYDLTNCPEKLNRFPCCKLSIKH